MSHFEDFNLVDMKLFKISLSFRFIPIKYTIIKLSISITKHLSATSINVFESLGIKFIHVIQHMITAIIVVLRHGIIASFKKVDFTKLIRLLDKYNRAINAIILIIIIHHTEIIGLGYNLNSMIHIGMFEIVIAETIIWYRLIMPVAITPVNKNTDHVEINALINTKIQNSEVYVGTIFSQQTRIGLILNTTGKTKINNSK